MNSKAPRAHGKLTQLRQINDFDWHDWPMILFLAVGFGIAGMFLFK